MKLTEKQLEEAVELFAQGGSRSKVVSYFMDTNEKLQIQIEMNEVTEMCVKQIRIQLGEQLRSVDPSSARFAKEKYQELFDLHSEAVQESVKNHYETILTRSVTLMEQQIETIATQLQILETAIAAAKVKIPETEKDYLAMLKMQDTLNLRLLEITDRLLERLSRATTLRKLNTLSNNPKNLKNLKI